MFTLTDYASMVRRLVRLGVKANKAVSDVATAYGLTVSDVKALRKSMA